MANVGLPGCAILQKAGLFFWRKGLAFRENLIRELIIENYHRFLLRRPAPSEVEYWLETYFEGTPLQDIAQAMQASKEHQILKNKILQNKIGLLHIPKTGGSALRDWLSIFIPHDRIFIYGSSDNSLLPQACLLAGHPDLAWLKAQGCTHIFCLLRNPIKRIISLYRYARSAVSGWPLHDPVKKLTFEEWLQPPEPEVRSHFDNYYLSAVGLPRPQNHGDSWSEDLCRSAVNAYLNLEAVGFIDNLPDFYARVAATLQINPPIQIPCKNTAKVNSSSDSEYPKKPFITPVLRELLERATRYDRVIFERILQIKELPT